MDPLSITTATIAIGGFCIQSVTLLSKFIDGARHVDPLIDSFRSEINLLVNIVQAIRQSFDEPDVVAAVTADQTSRSHGLWSSISETLQSCEDVMKGLLDTLESIDDGPRGILRRPLKQLKLSMKEGKISVLRAQLRSYHGMLNITLQSFTV